MLIEDRKYGIQISVQSDNMWISLHYVSGGFPAA